jgi:hypothetical protein
MFRRSFATWLEAHGVPGEHIDRLLRHSQKTVRGKHYSAADLLAKKRAVETIRLNLGKPEGGTASSKSSGDESSGESSEEPAAVPLVAANSAEEKGFEPLVPFGTAVFKTAAFDHSATPPSTLLGRGDLHYGSARVNLPLGALPTVAPDEAPRPGRPLKRA